MFVLDESQRAKDCLLSATDRLSGRTVLYQGAHDNGGALPELESLSYEGEAVTLPRARTNGSDPRLAPW